MKRKRQALPPVESQRPDLAGGVCRQIVEDPSPLTKRLMAEE